MSTDSPDKPKEACVRCGATGVMLMTFQANQGQPSKPVCLKCMQAFTRETIKRIRKR